MDKPCCIVCKRTIDEVNLHRSNPKGDPDPGWVCDDDMVEELPEERQKILDILTDTIPKELKND